MNVCFDVNAVVYLYTDAPQQAETLFAYDIANLRKFAVFVPASSPAEIHYILHIQPLQVCIFLTCSHKYNRLARTIHHR